jgi:hypothetical protein
MDNENKAFNAGFKQAIQLLVRNARDEEMAFIKRVLTENNLEPEYFERCMSGNIDDFNLGPCGRDQFWCPGYGCVSGSGPP